MSYSHYSDYSHVDANYGNYDDGAYYGAYHSGNGYNDYPGPPWPEPHEEYSHELTRRAAEYGLTPQELQEASEDCIHEQEILEQEYQEEMREAREARREAMGVIEELEELEELSFEPLLDELESDEPESLLPLSPLAGTPPPPERLSVR